MPAAAPGEGNHPSKEATALDKAGPGANAAATPFLDTANSPRPLRDPSAPRIEGSSIHGFYVQDCNGDISLGSHCWSCDACPNQNVLIFKAGQPIYHFPVPPGMGYAQINRDCGRPLRPDMGRHGGHALRRDCGHALRPDRASPPPRHGSCASPRLRSCASPRTRCPRLHSPLLHFELLRVWTARVRSGGVGLE